MGWWWDLLLMVVWTRSFARGEGEQQRIPKPFVWKNSRHPQHVDMCLRILYQRHDCCSVAVSEDLLFRTRRR